MANLSPKTQQALLEFYRGIKTIERLRNEADGDIEKLEEYKRVAEHGLRVTEQALSEEKSNKKFSGFGITPPSNGYLH